MARGVVCKKVPSQFYLVVSLGYAGQDQGAITVRDQKAAEVMAKSMATKWPSNNTFYVPLRGRVRCELPQSWRR